MPRPLTKLVSMRNFLPASKVVSWAALLFFAAAARAEPIIPKSFHYEVEAKQEKTADYCAIRLTIRNIPISPEVLKFRALVTKSTEAEAAVVGFSLEVENSSFSRGPRTSTKVVRLVKAAFVSQGFNSVGRFFGANFGGGRRGAMTSDGTVGEAFLAAFLKGNFDLSFVAQDGVVERTYYVSEPPPSSVVQAFDRCLQTIRAPRKQPSMRG
jgi:hypothetical protein